MLQRFNLQRIGGCPWNPVVFPSNDGEVEFAKEEQDPDAKGGEGPKALAFAMIRATREFTLSKRRW
jgi:hypothetical protein